MWDPAITSAIITKQPLRRATWTCNNNLFLNHCSQRGKWHRRKLVVLDTSSEVKLKATNTTKVLHAIHNNCLSKFSIPYHTFSHTHTNIEAEGVSKTYHISRFAPALATDSITGGTMLTLTFLQAALAPVTLMTFWCNKPQIKCSPRKLLCHFYSAGMNLVQLGFHVEVYDWQSALKLHNLSSCMFINGIKIYYNMKEHRRQLFSQILVAFPYLSILGILYKGKL